MVGPFKEPVHYHGTTSRKRPRNPAIIDPTPDRYGYRNSPGNAYGYRHATYCDGIPYTDCITY